MLAQCRDECCLWTAWADALFELADAVLRAVAPDAPT